MQTVSAPAQVDTALQCDHPHSRIVYNYFGNSQKHFGRQCLICGRWIEAIKKGCEEMRALSEIPPFDEALANAWDQQRQEYWQHQREQYENSRSAWREEVYEPYINGSAWQAKRRIILQRDNRTCQICGRPGYDVHHLTYAHFENEFLFELVCLCHNCHSLWYESTMV